MDKKGLTFTAIFLAESANYGEGIGNVATLKKISRNIFRDKLLDIILLNNWMKIKRT